MTKVSVVVPSYNQAGFIGRTLESIVSQDYPVEVIVIDGGSNDGSVDVIREFDSQIAYWVSEPDNGQTHAINKGMMRATGDLRAYLNSDDLYLPGAISSIVDAYENDRDADIFHGRCITIDEFDQRLEREFFSDIETVADILDLWNVWFEGRNFVQPEVFWTKRIADRVGPFDEARHYAMDYDYWARSIVAGARVHHVDKEVAAFRIWAQQKSSNSQQAADELRDIAIFHLRDKTTQIASATRRELAGDWTFDEVFSKTAGDLSDQQNSALLRRTKLAKLVAANPSLIFSRSFRRHASKIVSGWTGQTQGQET